MEPIQVLLADDNEEIRAALRAFLSTQEDMRVCGEAANGAEALRLSLETYFPGTKIVFVAGVLRDKDYGGMFDAVLPLADRFYTIAPPTPRALSAQALADYLQGRGAEAVPCASIREAVKQATARAGKDGVVCAFGSLYYIGQVRALFRY